MEVQERYPGLEEVNIGVTNMGMPHVGVAGAAGMVRQRCNAPLQPAERR